MDDIWENCPFRDRVSSSIDIYKAVHLAHGEEVVLFMKAGTNRLIEVLRETIGDNPDDIILEKIQGYCMDGVPFNGMRGL